MAINTPSTSRGQKRKCVVLMMTQKLDIIKYLEKGENGNRLMQEFNVGSSTIYDIKAQRVELPQFMTNSETSKAIEQCCTLHKPKLKQIENILYEWFALKCLEGAPFSGPMLIKKATDFYQQMGMTCVFSDGWLSCFKFCHGIRRLDAWRKKKSADHEAAEKYCGFFQELVVKHGIIPEQIYNADETGPFCCCLPTSTLAGADEVGAAGFKQSKDRLTVLMCANTVGTHRFKLLVVGKFRRPRAFKGVIHLPVEYKAQPNAWMDKEIFLHSFHHVFVPAVKEHLKKLEKPEDTKVILILHNCQAHPPEAELVSGNIFTIFLPAIVTSLIQPMDQGIIENLKSIYRRDFMRNLLNYEGSLQEFQSQYTIKDAIFNAWCAVKSTTLRKAWRKLWAAVTFGEGSSDEEEFAGVNVRQKKESLKEILDVLQNVDSTNPLTKLKDT
ncbi:LOW QUALITY PROTEIN: jerky protein homolog [Alligator mississippiensis]|uniref:LOW QUALITY PROTEIN: jerky protein homolog n=1 Tax=Alligator mississippiensis TaxID=8496 RepID=UPI002877FDC8|nr:LOW QUALITY PROTEIN: jerky protein homolog [Alligator mississippiensis]